MKRDIISPSVFISAVREARRPPEIPHSPSRCFSRFTSPLRSNSDFCDPKANDKRLIRSSSVYFVSSSIWSCLIRKLTSVGGICLSVCFPIVAGFRNRPPTHDNSSRRAKHIGERSFFPFSPATNGHRVRHFFFPLSLTA